MAFGDLGIFFWARQRFPKKTPRIHREMVTQKKRSGIDPAVLGTYADRLETLANVREAGISVSGLDMLKKNGSFSKTSGGLGTNLG